MKHRLFPILIAWLAGSALWANPITPCSAAFQYGCAQMVTGGYYVLTPKVATQSTEITAYSSNGTPIYDVTIPSPPNGPGSGAVSWEVSYAQTLLYDLSNPAYTGPYIICTGTPAVCQTVTNPGGSTVATSLILQDYIARDTPVTANVNQYQTTIVTNLNGVMLTTQTLNGAYGSAGVQSALQSAQASLSARGAAAGTPSLILNSMALSGTRVDYLETSSSNGTGVVSTEYIDTFGPAWIPAEGTFVVPFFVYPGQLDVRVQTTAQYYIDRTVTTTNTYLISQTYEIDGFTGASTPEPATLAMAGLGLGAVLMLRRRRGANPDQSC